MSDRHSSSSFAPIAGAEIYYETAGQGMPFIMLHAGVADHRQWNHEFAHFGRYLQVIRFDQRGFGRSEPAEGEFSNLQNLTALLDHLKVTRPAVLMGCSMGGGLAIDFALDHPNRVRALILVGSGPTGLELDVPPLAQFAAAEKAYLAGDLDLLAEIETQVWFDGLGRTPDQVDPDMRRLAYEMNRLALAHNDRQLGKRLPDSPEPAVARLGELQIPVLIVVGEHDIPYIQLAADYMVEHLPDARKTMIDAAAHLPNMDQPQVFRAVITDFLQAIGAL